MLRSLLRKSEPTIEEKPPWGSLDVARRGDSPTPGVLHATGWATDAKGSLAVELEVDGVVVGRAGLGVPRPDLLPLLGPHAALAGWECIVDLGPEPRSTVEVAAMARSRTGRRHRIGTARVDLSAWHRPASPQAPAADRTRLRERGRLLLTRAPVTAAAAGPVRIVAFIHSFRRAGSQLILLERLRELVATGHVEAVAVSPVDGMLRAELEELGIACHLTADVVPADEAHYEGRITELAAWCQPQRFDLVVASGLSSGPAIEVAERLGLPSLWLLYEEPLSPRHLSPGVELNFPDYALELTNEAIRRCPLLVFDSEARRLAYAPRTTPERLLRIPGAIDLEAIDLFRATFDRRAARQARGIADDETLILLLGSILRMKGTPLLAQAFASLAAERPALRLALVGSHGDGLAQAIGEYFAALGLAERTIIEPMGRHPYPWLAMADVLTCPSDRESLPRVVLEGLAFELPVVATAVGDIPTVIADGQTGWLVPPNDPVALENALRAALDAPAGHREALARAGLRRVRDRHDTPRAAAAFSAAVEQLVPRASGLLGRKNR
jgi:glycosyltransferase involved in cell wall biosynthesis